LPHPSLDEEISVIGNREHFDEIALKLLGDIPLKREALHKAYRESLDRYKEIDDLVSLDSKP